MDTQTKFYHVYCPGHNPEISRRYETRAEAKHEAAQITARNGLPSYVLGFEGVCYIRDTPVVYKEQGADINTGGEEVVPKVMSEIERAIEHLQKMAEENKQNPSHPFYPINIPPIPDHSPEFPSPWMKGPYCGGEIIWDAMGAGNHTNT